VNNFLAERVNVVAPWLVKKILHNQKNGVEIKYSNFGRMLISALSVLIGKKDLFKDLA
jgi:hypothetical protein